MSESFAELFEESFASQQLKSGAIITGTVVAVNDDVVMISAGLKSEAVIPIEQFQNDQGEANVSVGDEFEVALDAVEDGFGETKLSREKAIRARTWIELEKSFEKSEVVTGIINGRVKGGFTVEIDNVRAFLPGSLVDVRPVRDPAYLEGKSLEFKVIKLDQRRNNVVVSRRAVVEQEYSAEREQLLESLQEGKTVKGIVKNLTDYGAFVDLGGIDGLLHITDMAWKRVKHPSEVVNVGEEIDIKILKFDRERQRVSLGIKQLGDDPWHDLARRYPPNSRLFGKITNIADYGCFVEIEEGVGPTRTSIHPRLCKSEKKSRCWSSRSMKSVDVFLLASNSVKPTHGQSSPRQLIVAIKSAARSSLLPTSVFSLDSTAA
jgi:small subunit ribosomal protein S1